MSRNAFAQLDSDDSDNEDVKADITVETPTVDDGANIDATRTTALRVKRARFL